MAAARTGRHVALAGIAASALLAALNIVVGLLTHSTSVLAAGLEFAGDVLVSSIVVLGLVAAAKPADEEHPYGHGRLETLAAFVVGLVLAAGGSLIAWTSLQAVGEQHAPPGNCQTSKLGMKHRSMQSTPNQSPSCQTPVSQTYVASSTLRHSKLDPSSHGGVRAVPQHAPRRPPHGRPVATEDGFAGAVNDAAQRRVVECVGALFVGCGEVDRDAARFHRRNNTETELGISVAEPALADGETHTASNLS